jgi:hypothetical protein
MSDRPTPHQVTPVNTFEISIPHILLHRISAYRIIIAPVLLRSREI